MTKELKVAITCDYLLERNHYIEIIELICEIFPEARLYCFAHKKGAILGHIEHRMISSTFLSHKVATEEEFYSHSYQIPSLAKNLFVSCEYDLIINISKGFSQGIKKCDQSKLITYLYDLGYEGKIKHTLVQRIFSSFVESWAMKSLQKSDLVILSRPDLKEKLKNIVPNADVVPPPFRVSDYSLFPKNMFKHHFFAIEATGLSSSDALQISEWMKEWGEAFQFVGADDHLNNLKENFPSNTFFGNRCSGEHAPVLASSRALISFNQNEFPNLVMATMATGRPVIAHKNLIKWVSGNGFYEVLKLDKESLKQRIDQVHADEENLDGQKIRANVMEYHDIKFKSHLKRTLDKFLLDHNHSDGESCESCCS